MPLTTLEKSIETKSPGENARWGFIVGIFACFAVALGAALAHVFAHHPETRIIQDSEFFLSTGERLARLMFAPQSVDFSLADFRWSLVNNGPVMPLLVAFCSVLSSKLLCSTSSTVFVVQCFMHACTASILCRLGAELTKCKKAGLIAGLVWGLYPAAICGSCLLMAECMTVLSLVLLVWLNTRFVASNGKAGWAYAVGLCTTWVLFTRAALLPACFAIDLAAYAFIQVGRRAKFKLLALSCAGLATLIAPWAVATKMLGGNAEFLPNRNGSWNLCLGCDTSADSWQTMPVTEFTCNNYQRKPAGIIRNALKLGPAELGTMMVRKVTRLWGRPWLDYHKEILGFDVDVITGLHQTLIFTGLFGFLSLLARLRSIRTITTPPSLQKYMAVICVAVIAAHFCFIPFEAIARYSFPAIPFVLLAAVFGLNQLQKRKKLALFLVAMAPAVVSLLCLWHCDLIPYLVQLFGSAQASQIGWLSAHALLLAYTITCSWLFLREKEAEASQPFLKPAILTSALFVSLSLFSHSKTLFSEWSCLLSESTSAGRSVLLTDSTNPLTIYQPTEQAQPVVMDPAQAAWAAILVDADSSVDSAVFRINGRQLTSKPVSMYDVPDPYRYQVTKIHVLKTVTQARNDSLSDIRQWRLVPVPLAYLNLHGRNTIEATTTNSRSPVTIYGDYASRGDQRMPSLKYYTVGKLQFSLNEREGRSIDACRSEAITSENWLSTGSTKTSDDLSPAGGLQNGRYRMFVALAFKTTGSPGQQAHPDVAMPLTFGEHTMQVY